MELTTWPWFALTCILLVLEITIPITFFLWLAAAALTSTVVAFFMPSLSWQVELSLFSAFVILSILIWAKRPKHVQETDQPGLNERNNQYLGATVVVCNEIKNGVGKVKVNDSIWKAHGADAKVGTQVRVRRVEGSVFHIESL
jgi:hypothetical protein